MITIKEIKAKLATVQDRNDPFIDLCKNDNRKGVEELLTQWEKRVVREEKSALHFAQLCKYEEKLRVEGFQLIAGVDEAGRGPLAGPVVAGAVILPITFNLPGLNDSKQLSAQNRDTYFDIIAEQAISVGVGVIDSHEIDKINIYEATKKAMLEAIGSLPTLPDFALLDAMNLDLPIPQLSLIKGDAKSVSIAAASVVAKVTRDRMMLAYAELHPQYGFEKHMGYGTALHLEAIKKYGPTDWHRMSFAPLKDWHKQ